MVHVFSKKDKNIVIDGNSGSIVELDDIAYEFIKESSNFLTYEETIEKFKDKYDIGIIKSVYNEIKELKEKGILFSEEIEDINYKKYVKGIKALCLHVAHDCNLLCEYCFASKGDYKTSRKLMDKKTGLKAVDFLIKNSADRKNIEIDFFGGEPLMNFDVVKEILIYGREEANKLNKNIYFTITTNGLLLDENKIDYINENMDNVVISIDGRKSVHDSIRYDRFGNGSYDRVLENAKLLVGKRNNKSYYIRGTFTNKNLDFSNDVFHLADLGFKEISIEPVVGSGEEYHLKKENLPDILDEYDKLMNMYIARIKNGQSFNFYHFNMNIYEGPCINKRIAACGAGYEYLSVTPEGNLFPCHQFVGENNFIMGNVNEGIINNTIKERFNSANILTKEECKKCWAKLYCSGGCHANSYFSQGDIMKKDELVCEMQKRRIECAIIVEIIKNEKQL